MVMDTDWHQEPKGDSWALRVDQTSCLYDPSWGPLSLFQSYDLQGPLPLHGATAPGAAATAPSTGAAPR